MIEPPAGGAPGPLSPDCHWQCHSATASGGRHWQQRLGLRQPRDLFPINGACADAAGSGAGANVFFRFLRGGAGLS